MPRVASPSPSPACEDLKNFKQSASIDIEMTPPTVPFAGEAETMPSWTANSANRCHHQHNGNHMEKNHNPLSEQLGNQHVEGRGSVSNYIYNISIAGPSELHSSGRAIPCCVSACPNGSRSGDGYGEATPPSRPAEQPPPYVRSHPASNLRGTCDPVCPPPPMVTQSFSSLLNISKIANGLCVLLDDSDRINRLPLNRPKARTSRAMAVTRPGEFRMTLPTQTSRPYFSSQGLSGLP